MNRYLIPFALALLAACGAEAHRKKNTLEAAQAVAAEVPPALMQAVSAAVADGGPAQALEFCRDQAGPLAKGRQEGLLAKIQAAHPEVKKLSYFRSSDRLRNPANAVETRITEPEVLRFIDDWYRSPQPAAVCSGQVCYGLTPIRITNPMCLNCHGDLKSADPSLKTALNRLYPGDRATGYKLGDLRGVLITRVGF